MRILCPSLVVASLSLSSLAGAQEHKVDAARAAAEAGGFEQKLALLKTLRRAGRTGEAASEAFKVQLSAKTPEERARASYETMRVRADQRDHAKAMSACATVHERALRHACQAEVHVTVKKRGSEAQADLDAALKLDPSLFEARYVLGLVEALASNVPAAEEALTRAIAKDATRVEAHVALGRARAAGGKHKEAEEALRKAVSVDADDPDALFELGKLLAKGAEARGLLERATKARPSNGHAFAALAEALVLAGDGPAAARAAEAASKLDPKQADWLAVLAEARVLERRFDDAIQQARAAIALSAQHGKAHLALADALAGKSDIDGAIAAYQTAAAALRTDPSALVRGARASLAQARETTAKAFADRATKEFEAHGPAWEVLGDVARARGDKADAVVAYERALAAKEPVADRAVLAQKLAAVKK